MYNKIANAVWPNQGLPVFADWTIMKNMQTYIFVYHKELLCSKFYYSTMYLGEWNGNGTENPGGWGGQTEKTFYVGGRGYCYFMQPYSEDEINKNVHL